jgi:hypothetical protein
MLIRKATVEAGIVVWMLLWRGKKTRSTSAVIRGFEIINFSIWPKVCIVITSSKATMVIGWFNSMTKK